MSDKTPYIGDIWLDRDGRKLFLFQVTEKYLHFLRMKSRYPANLQRVVMITYVRSTFNYQEFTYVGKSKCSINALFETEDEPHGLYCNTCGRNVFDDPLDYYMLKDKVWKEICDKRTLSPHKIICKRCGEKFLGRKFTPEDMTDAPVNYFYNDDGTRILKILKGQENESRNLD